MPIRAEVTAARTALAALDAGLAAPDVRLADPTAQVAIGRARGYMRAASDELYRAIAYGLEPAIDHVASTPPGAFAADAGRATAWVTR